MRAPRLRHPVVTIARQVGTFQERHVTMSDVTENAHDAGPPTNDALPIETGLESKRPAARAGRQITSGCEDQALRSAFTRAASRETFREALFL